MKPTLLTLSLCMGFTVLGCAYGPTGPGTSAPSEVAANQQATGRLVIQLAAPAGRKTLAFAEDLKRIEVTLRRHRGDAVETVGQATLKAESNWKFEVFNLPPGTYDLQLIAYDRGQQAVQLTAPAPYQAGPYEVRPYELAVASIALPLQPNHVVIYETPKPKPAKTPDDKKPDKPGKPDQESPTSSGTADQAGVGTTPSPTPTPSPEPTVETPTEPTQNQTQEGGDS